jgi:hypothetical protein
MFPCASVDRGCATGPGDVRGLSSRKIVRVRALALSINNRAFCQLPNTGCQYVIIRVIRQGTWKAAFGNEMAEIAPSKGYAFQS